MVDVRVRYDPFDAEILNDPYPTYRMLRDTTPVYRAEESHTWVLSRHADVQAAALDHGTYSSVGGIFPTPPGSNFIGSFLPMMIVMDPPRHDQLRALVSRAFTPRRVAGLQDGVTRMAAELFDRLDEGSGSADFVTDFAAILPAAVIADLLGVPAADRDRFRLWSSQLVQVDVTHGQTTDALAAAASIYAYFTEFLADRRKTPREDLMSALANAAVYGIGLTDEEVIGLCALLLVADSETPTNLLGNSAVVLAQHPRTRRRLASDRTLLGPAVEELLRYDSPAQGLSRTLTRDVVLHDTTMRQGDRVLLLFGSANRDDRAFPDPDVFDVDRTCEHQVAFGRGIHFCLGAALARMEARIALNALLDKVPDWEVDLESAVRLRSGPIRGYTSLPITWNAPV